MIEIVKLALRKPYTFVVMAILIGILGILSAIRAPVDIFPEIKIPVISVVWSYTGLPPEDMAGRVIYAYERSLTTTVNDIEHIESQSFRDSCLLLRIYQLEGLRFYFQVLLRGESLCNLSPSIPTS